MILFDMQFSSSFLKHEAYWLQARERHVHLNEYAKHLLRYCDNRFGRHPWFRYFLLNIIIRHRAYASSMVFLKNNMKNLPTTMENLREHFQNPPDWQIGEIFMPFGTILRGTRAYWNKCHVELSKLVEQIGCPTILFTLNEANMKWPY